MVAPYIANLHSTVPNPAVDIPRARLQVADHDVASDGHADQPTMLSAPLTSLLTLELDGAAQSLGLAAEEILLAALGRTIARTIGDGVVAVDVARDGRPALHSVDLTCATEQQMSATNMVGAVHHTLAAKPPRGIGSGIMQYFDAAHTPSEVCFNNVGALTAPPADEPECQHALELRVSRSADQVHLDWWYDDRRFDRATVHELTEQFPFALIELTSEATPPV